MIQMNLENRIRLSDLENELVFARGKGGGGEGIVVWDGHVHTAIFQMDNQQGLTV